MLSVVSLFRPWVEQVKGQLTRFAPMTRVHRSSALADSHSY
jgi:hypothetical protein